VNTTPTDWSTGLADRSSTAAEASGLATWIDRGVALFCLGSLLPASFMAADQLPHLHPGWVTVVGGGIVLTSSVMVAMAWMGRRITILAGLYVVLVFGGLVSWPWAWQSPDPAAGSPWLWMSMGISTICFALVAGTRWGIMYALVSGIVFAIIRMTPSGQGIPPFNAAQDMLLLLVNPMAVLLGLGLITESVRELDASLAAAERDEAEAAVEAALVDQRRRLDGIIHDEVMTTLVAAARTDGRDPAVTRLASQALTRLAEADLPPDPDTPVSSHHLAWLVQDVVASVLPQAEVRTRFAGRAVMLPQPVAGAIGQAVREAVLNVARHANAEHVVVEVADAPDARAGVEVRVADDGVGFDPRHIPPNRLGLRVSVTERMRSIGGRAQILSKPGRGTEVRLTWLVPQRSPARAVPRERRRTPSAPVLPSVRGEVLVRLVWLLVGLQFLLGWTSLDVVLSAWPVLAAQALSAAATLLALHRIGDNPMPLGRAWAVVALMMAVSVMVHSVLPMGTWPGYATWHSSVLMVLLIVLLFRGREPVAWSGVALFSVASLAWAYSHGLGFGDAFRVAFGPFSWLVVARLLRTWLADIGERLVASRGMSAQANQEMARSFSRLVLSDIWLTQLRAQVGPLLSKVADPDAALTAADRDACLALEARLRDDMRAGNLVSPSISDAIEAARRRGVEVTVVDNRGSQLPDAVRRATSRHLDRVLSEPATRRVVARAAPEGYADAVTILTVREDGSSELASVDDDGVVSGR